MQPLESVAQRIFVIRGLRVILDADLARLYGVTPKRFNEQVRRNHKRFPSAPGIHGAWNRHGGHHSQFRRQRRRADRLGSCGTS
jgi:hypothetical protein